MVMMAGCAEQQVFYDAALDASAQEKEAESLNGLMTRAKWGDGDAYLKMADYYVNGQDGKEPDLMMTMVMLTMAEEYDAISRPEEYMSKLPEENNTRMAFEAMECVDGSQKEKGLELAERLVSKNCPDGYAIQGFACMEAGDTVEAMRLVALAAEQGSTLGMALQYVIPHTRMSDKPDESVMLPIAETVPIFYLFMAEEYYKHLAEHPENEVKIARSYLKADENGFLDKRGAEWLLSYMERGNSLPLSDTDILRLLKLADCKKVDATTDEYDEYDEYDEDEPDRDLWEEPVDSVAIEEAIETVEAAKRAAEAAKAKEDNNNDEGTITTTNTGRCATYPPSYLSISVPSKSQTNKYRK